MPGPSQSACSTNWKAAVLPSKRNQMTSDSANTTSVVTSAIQRALLATALSDPRVSRMAATPTSGRKVTMLRMGQPFMVHLTST